MLSSCTLISKSSSPFTNPLLTVSPSTSCSIVFFSVLQPGLDTYLSLFLLLNGFSHQLMVVNWSLSDSKSLQDSKTRLCILACPPIFNSSRSLSRSFGAVPSLPTAIGITVTFIFYRFFCSLERSKYFVSLFSFFDFHTLVSHCEVH